MRLHALATVFPRSRKTGATWAAAALNGVITVLSIRASRSLCILTRTLTRKPSAAYSQIMAPRARRGKFIEPMGFSALSKTEQIRYLQALWDRISEKPGEIPVPDSHLDLAKERLAAYRRDPHRARPAREVLDRLANPDR